MRHRRELFDDFLLIPKTITAKKTKDFMMFFIKQDKSEIKMPSTTRSLFALRLNKFASPQQSSNTMLKITEKSKLKVLTDAFILLSCLEKAANTSTSRSRKCLISAAESAQRKFIGKELISEGQNYTL